jgi:hypothetical protein
MTENIALQQKLFLVLPFYEIFIAIMWPQLTYKLSTWGDKAHMVENLPRHKALNCNPSTINKT